MYLFRITVFSHNFAITEITPNSRYIIEGFLRKFIQWGFVKNEHRQWIRQALRTFASETRDKQVVRFHINVLNAFYRYLQQNNIDPSHYVIEQAPIYVPAHVSLPIQDHWVTRDYQEPVIEFATTFKPSTHNPELPISKLIELQTGKGKATTLDSKIKIPGGWSTMGEMKVGTIVTAKDGSPTKVTAVHPQGKTDVYRVTFWDGRFVDCCPEHLWRVFYINSAPHKRWRVVNTLEVLRLISMPNPRVYVDLIDPEDCQSIDLPISPYILGIYLGDGSSAGENVNVTTPDCFIANELKSTIDSNCSISKYSNTNCPTYGIKNNKENSNSGRNQFRSKLIQLGLCGKLHFEKFIPEVYLHASKAQRLALLQGLMDTDGTVNSLESGGAISYSTPSEQLAKDVQYLVRSLGGIASISSRYPTFTYKGEKKTGRLAYNVNIRYKKPSELFKLPRKKERTNDKNQYAQDLKLRVKTVEFIGVKETQCISIDHPDRLYVTNDFIVTHNSYSFARSASIIGTRVVGVLRAQYIDKWQEDVMKLFDIDFEDVAVVRGSGSLKALLEMANADELDYKIILISNKTLQPWFKIYEEFRDDSMQLGYGCRPHELFQTLKAGMRLIDEVHQDFHFNFKLDTYTHVIDSISLSATLLGDDDFVNRMYLVAYPMDNRYQGPEYDRYVNSIAVFYEVKEPNKLRYKDYVRKSYSHNMLEQSIVRHKELYKNYLEMIVRMIEAHHFDKDYKPGEKILIYCASIDFCTRLANHLKQVYPNKDVRRYVEDDPYDNLMTGEIVVSTLLSAGTGHDIAMLKTVLLTVAINSSQGNIQGFGRLRKLDNMQTRFIYLVCSSIKKHCEYHERKKTLLETRALNMRTEYYPKAL